MSCFREDISWRATSLNIDRLASRGVLFADAFAPAIPMDPGWTTLSTGVRPLKHCIVSHTVLTDLLMLALIGLSILFIEILS